MFFSLQCSLQTGSQAHIYPYSVDTGVYFPGIKRSEHKAVSSAPSNAEVKSEWT